MDNTAVCDELLMDSSFLYRAKYPFLIHVIEDVPSIVMDRSVWSGSFISEAYSFEGVIQISSSLVLPFRGICKNVFPLLLTGQYHSHL
jgi:hypothetical protein